LYVALLDIGVYEVTHAHPCLLGAYDINISPAISRITPGESREGKQIDIGGTA